MDGKINGRTSPTIEIEFSGPIVGAPIRVTAIVDTGFTGSVSIPIQQALPLGLMLFSTATFTLADGSKEDTFLCLGRAKVEGVERPVVFSLTKGSDILVGTEFLATFKAHFELDYQTGNLKLVVQIAQSPSAPPPSLLPKQPDL